jgi:voltage-gated potassium channel
MNSLLASPLRNLIAGAIYLVTVAAAAVVAYCACGWPVSDALYMVIMTIYTVGYGEVHPVDTPPLRLVTMTLIVAGCTGMIFLTGVLVQLITAAQLQHFLGIRRMTKDIDALQDHVIICGYGRIGQMLAKDLQAGRVACLILERSEPRLNDARAQGHLCLQGDATDEDVLRAAGITRARAAAIVLPNDAANVFITLSARSLNRKLTIIARGEAPSTESKLLQAGADRVVLPAHIGAERIAELVMFQDMTRMLDGFDSTRDVARDLRRLGLDLEVVLAAPGSRCAGYSIGALEIAAAGAFLVVALKRVDGPTILQPSSDTVIHPGDGVALVGRPGRAQAIEENFGRPMTR